VGSGPGSPFEFAVSAAASIGVHLVGQGIETRLITESGEVTPAGPAAESLLERLAVIQSSRNTDLGRGVATLRASSRGQVIAVTGMLSPDQARLLAASHQGTAPAMAMLLDGVNWNSGRSARSGTAGGNGAAADILTAAGWRVSVVSGGTSLAQAWRELHSPATAGFLHRSVSTEAPPIPGPALHVPAAAPPEVTG
jgi:hypothetical protein